MGLILGALLLVLVVIGGCVLRLVIKSWRAEMASRNKHISLNKMLTEHLREVNNGRA
jgi:hypothetical protein